MAVPETEDYTAVCNVGSVRRSSFSFCAPLRGAKGDRACPSGKPSPP